MEGGTLTGQPDMLNPTGKTQEIIPATYGNGEYEYDNGRWSSPEEFLAYTEPSEQDIEAYYDDEFEASPVKQEEINGYTVYSQRFEYHEYGKPRRIWHMALKTKADKLLTIKFWEASDTDVLDVPLSEDWYVRVIETLEEG